MTSVAKILAGMKANASSVSFSDLKKVCTEYFGEPRQESTSHVIYKMTWAGDPRVNIQSDKGKAKSYQVKQVLAAIARMENEGQEEENNG